MTANSSWDGTIAQAIAWARARIGAADAGVLLRHVLDCNAAYLTAHGEEPLAVPHAQAFRALVERRTAGEPVAYIVAHREFYGVPLKVGPQVLIPRPETELLVDAALERIAPGAAARVLDLATGSGCVAIAIALQRPAARVTATDISPQAIALARENAANLAAQNVEFRTGDWFAAVQGERFDIVVANPPYVAAGDPHLSEGDVRFEPRAALIGGEDGLECIRAIVADAPAYLLPRGWLAFEHGYDQAERSRELMRAAGFEQVRSQRDLAGHERVTEGRHP